MSETNKDSSLTDPLSEVTRKERRMLLGLSILGVFFIQAGAIPSKISALGINLETSDQRAFLYLMSTILVYFTIAFFIYAMSDFIVWRRIIEKEYIDAYREYMHERENYPNNHFAVELDAEAQNAHKKNIIWNKLAKPMSVSRAIFEFLLPLIVGIYSIAIMAIHAYTHI